MLRAKTREFIENSGIPKTVFCRRIGVSTQHFYNWLNKGVDISDELESKIRHYIDKHEIQAR